MTSITKQEAIRLSKLLSQILSEQVEPEMIMHEPVNSWPAAVIQALKQDKKELIFGVSQNEVRPIVIDAITKLCLARMKALSDSLAFQFVAEASSIYRIQDTGHESSIYYSFGTGRYNCPNDKIKVMYCGEFPDTCMAEIIMRDDPYKGKGPASVQFSRKDEWFEKFDLGVSLAVRRLKLLDSTVLKAQLQLSGKLTTDDYLWTHGIVAAISALGLDIDGIAYESAHLGHGKCYALFDKDTPQLTHKSLTKLSECEVDAQLVVQNQYTLDLTLVSMKGILTNVLNGKIVNND
ncbi:RES domain-containing protein [Vibrio parahaemolyticus]|nr:RES domain-containing protein [Vibrio parahaemolyticus]